MAHEKMRSNGWWFSVVGICLLSSLMCPVLMKLVGKQEVHPVS